MDVNGDLIVQGGVNDPELSNVADTTVAGELATQKQGVLKFSNGVKIQWDTVDAGANGISAFSLPENYTEAHYNVIGSYSEDVGASPDETSLMFYVPNTNTLSNVRCTNARGTTTKVTYVSIGKDLV